VKKLLDKLRVVSFSALDQEVVRDAEYISVGYTGAHVIVAV